MRFIGSDCLFFILGNRAWTTEDTHVRGVGQMGRLAALAQPKPKPGGELKETAPGEDENE
jgi:hypothetical protein